MDASKNTMAADGSGSPASTGTGFWQRLFAPVDIAVLVYFRLVFGVILLWDATHYLYYGLVPYYYDFPEFYFTYYGFDWVRPWPLNWMTLHFYGLAVLAVCIAAGLFYRLAAVCNFLRFTYVFLLDSAVAQNHYYLVCLLSFLMIFVPAHRSFSLDAWLRPKLRSSTAPAWSLWILRFQIAIPYVYGGITKLNWDWLRGMPVRYGLEAGTHYPELATRLDQEWVITTLTYGGLLFDLSVVPLLLWKRTRWLGAAAAVAFNLTNSQIFKIGIFPWLMLGSTFLFFSPSWPRRLLRRAPVAATGAAPPGSRLSPRQRATAAALGIYVAYQVLMPFRHHLYPGDVNWNEQGRHFSWRMMSAFKLCSCRLYVTIPETGQRRTFNTKDFVTRLQIHWAERDPDMIWQLCQFVAKAVEAEGYGRPQVRVQAVASLNGRDPQLIIDPSVDLAAQRRNFSTAPWILPLNE